MITEIRCERTYLAGDSDGWMQISVSIPSSKRIPLCLPETESKNAFVCRFVCRDLNWTTESGKECWVLVKDPAVGVRLLRPST